MGFSISPVLWRKLPGARSAGRVQSVALRLLCEREAEVEAFKVPCSERMKCWTSMRVLDLGWGSSDSGSWGYYACCGTPTRPSPPTRPPRHPPLTHRKAGTFANALPVPSCTRQPEQYWTIDALLATEDGSVFSAHLTEVDGERCVGVTTAMLGEILDLDRGSRVSQGHHPWHSVPGLPAYPVLAMFACVRCRVGPRGFPDKQEAIRVMERLKATSLEVSGVTLKDQRRNPSAPFTTSTMQQEAARRLGMTTSATMRNAQVRNAQRVDGGTEGQADRSTDGRKQGRSEGGTRQWMDGWMDARPIPIGVFAWD